MQWRVHNYVFVASAGAYAANSVEPMHVEGDKRKSSAGGWAGGQAGGQVGGWAGLRGWQGKAGGRPPVFSALLAAKGGGAGPKSRRGPAERSVQQQASASVAG